MSTSNKQNKMAASLAKTVSKAVASAGADKKTTAEKKSAKNEKANIVFSSRRVWPD